MHEFVELGFADDANTKRSGLVELRARFSPATRKSVFFETLLAAWPPCWTISDSISSRL